MRFSFLVCLLVVFFKIDQINGVHILDTKMISNKYPHNGFTDLIRYKEAFYCAFRGGVDHAKSIGNIQILSSNTGEDWEECAQLDHEYADLRDPKLIECQDGKLMLVGCVNRFPGGASNGVISQYETWIWFSDDAINWGEPQKVNLEIDSENIWLWRIVCFNQKFYAIGYDAKGDERGFSKAIHLFESDDGIQYSLVKKNLLTENAPSEAGLVFQKNGTAIALVRHEGVVRGGRIDPGSNVSKIGRSLPPYTEWEWSSSEVIVHSPHLLVSPKGNIVAGGRKLVHRSCTTSLFELNDTATTITPLIDFRSSGDCAYPGLAFHDNQLWASYYSSHDSKASIYISTVSFDE